MNKGFPKTETMILILVDLSLEQRIKQTAFYKQYLLK